MIEEALASDINHITVKKIASRKVAWIQTTLSPKRYFDLEPSIRQLERNQKDTIVWLGKVGVGIKKEKLEQGKFDEYDCVFITLDNVDNYIGETEVWPEVNCVCIRFRGSHKDASEHYGLLMDYIEKYDMEVAGFSREVTLIDECITSDKNLFVTEIQIPIVLFNS